MRVIKNIYLSRRKYMLILIKNRKLSMIRGIGRKIKKNYVYRKENGLNTLLNIKLDVI